MSISPICDKCKKELVDYGGILLGPPDKYNVNSVTKYHLCQTDYQTVLDWLLDREKVPVATTEMHK